MIDLRKLKKSFEYAFCGIKDAVSSNQNFRIHFFSAIVAIALGLFFKINLLEWSVLVTLISLVLSLEMLNAATEKIVDLIVSEHRKEAKFIKDVGAGMVLIAAIGAAIVALLIFLPRLAALFR